MKTYSVSSMLPKALLIAAAAVVIGTAAPARAASALPVQEVAGSLVKADALHGVLLGGVKHLMQPSAAVPEPSAWAMMVIGAGALALVLRARAHRA